MISRPNRKRMASMVLAASTIAGLGASAHATNRTWNVGSGSWSVGTNWNPTGAPANGDTAFLTSTDGAARTVTYDNANAALVFANVVVNASSGGTFTLDQSTLSLSTGNVAIGTTGRGIYNQNGGTLDTNTMNMATAANANATFNHSAGVATIDTLTVGVFTNANVIQSGGTIECVNVNLSQTGNGTITHTLGSLNVSDTLTISDTVAGGSGVYTLQGGTLTAAAVVINSGGGINHVGGTINTPSLTLNSGGTFSAGFAPEFLTTFNQNGGTIVTDFLVGGGNTLLYNSGSFPNRLDSFGRVTFNGDMTMGNGWLDRFSGIIDIAAARTVTCNGAGLSHGDGTITLSGILNTTDSLIGGNGVVSAPNFVHQIGVHNVSHTLHIGDGFAAGTYSLNGGTLNVPASAIGAVVGVNQPGVLNIGNGRANITTLTIGAGGAGTVNHSGTGDLIGNTLIVGDTTVGNYIQNNAGAAVTVTTLFIAKNPSAGASRYDFSNGTLTFNIAQNNGSFTMTGGRVNNTQAMVGTGSLAVTNNGSLITNALILGRVALANNGKIFTRPNGNALGVSVVKQLFVAESAPNTFEGQFDLNDNAMAVDYTGASVISDISRYIKSGYANGSWNGTGLSSTAAAASPASARTGLGFVEASDIFTTFPANFIGNSVDNTTVLIRHTLSGDANLDRKVNALDFNALASNFGTGIGHVWTQGDFNYDGTTNTQDFTALATNFGQVMPSPALGSLVPEPAAITFVLGALMSARRRRTNACQAR